MARSVEDRRESEKRVSGLMIELYCRKNHGSGRGELCDECRALRDYAFQRIDRCPYMETRTFCSNCRTHCYKPEMRERIRTVMRFSGPRMILYHPVMAMRHVVSMKREKRKLTSS